MKSRKLRSVFFNGILTENPTFRLVLGTCPTIAVSTSAVNGLGMGAAVTFVLLGSNVIISLLRNFIPEKVRIPAYIVVICTFVTIVQMVLQGFIPSLYDSLGMFIPLIVVNCIILARAEAFASKNPVGASAIDAIGMGIGFTIAITLIGCVRELIGSGTIGLFGLDLLSIHFEPMLLIALAPGGFIVFGLLLGIFNAITNRAAARKSAKEVRSHE